jgi:hypothetical protein
LSYIAIEEPRSTGISGGLADNHIQRGFGIISISCKVLLKYYLNSSINKIVYKKGFGAGSVVQVVESLPSQL